MYRLEHDSANGGLPETQTKYLTISNINSLDLNAQLSTSAHYQLVDAKSGEATQQLLVHIKTGSSVHVAVVFDTRFKRDRHNEIVQGTLTIGYLEHEHSDLVRLSGEIHFPNVHLETNRIDFGCILNNTEVVQKIRMTNSSPLPVSYKWKFVLEKNNVISNSTQTYTQRQQQQHQKSALNETSTQISSQSNIDNLVVEQLSHSRSEGEEETAVEAVATEDKQQNQSLSFNNNNEPERTTAAASAVASSKVSLKLEELLEKPVDLDIPSIEEIFDISPLYGNLDPGEAQMLTVTYYGHKEIKAYAKAVCEVHNGPEYEVLLKGEASVLNYELSNKMIDFGCIVSFVVVVDLFFFFI